MKTKTFILGAVAVFAVIVGGVIYVAAGGGGDRRLGSLAESGISGYEVRFTPPIQVTPLGGRRSEVILCPAGKKALGGGAKTERSMVIHSSFPYGSGSTLGTGWSFVIGNPDPLPYYTSLYVICANVS